KAKVPGFRPGKAPRNIVEKRFQKQIEEELNENLFHLAIDEAIKKEDLRVLDFSAPQNLNTLPDGGISFISTLIVAPEIELPEYKGLKVSVPADEVPAAEIEAQLKSLQERFAEFEAIEGRAAAMEDFAIIDYSSTVDGKPTEEFLGKPAGYIAAREGFWVRLRDDAFLPGFAPAVVGMEVGQTKEITLTLPADFPVADLCNREIVFKTTLKELKRSILPELNDELANRLAPGKTLEEIKTIIGENMQQERKRHIEDSKINQLIAQLTAKAAFELPQDLIDQETQNQADAMVRRGIYSGMSEEDVASQQEEIFASARNQALVNLRANFILQEIARAEQLTVTEGDLLGQLAQQARQRNTTIEKYIKEVRRSGRMQSIRNSILIGKSIDFVVKAAEVSIAEEKPADAN
ncbi:MAG TPA: trigger factor, partial [Luteolibacter sp.]|nr:trigger factor [Luteolibacter sp.]